MTLAMQAQSRSFRLVRQFMGLCGQRTPAEPTEPTPEERARMAAIIFEEVMETIWKGLGVECRVHQGVSGSLDSKGCLYHTMNGENTVEFVPCGEFNMIEAIDGALDTKVTANAILIGCGVADLELTEEVDQNNLGKFGPGSWRRDDGKHMKPEGYPAPKIAEILARQGWVQK
jgi:predicted HAD superfamily Cof-like phosphohydrolase